MQKLGIKSLSDNISNGVTQKYFQPQLVDAVFKPSPFWWRLTRLGRKFQGGAIVWTLINQEELTGGAFWGTQLLSTDVTDSAQPAELQWRAYNQLCAIPIIDAILNQGPPGVVNLVRVKEEIAFASLLMKLNRAAQRTSPQNTAIDIDGVPIALAASGTYAGVTIQNNATTGFVWECNGGAGPQTMAALNTLAGSAAGTALSLAGMQYAYGEYPNMHFRMDPYIQPSNQYVAITRVYVMLQLQFLSLRNHARITTISNA